VKKLTKILQNNGNKKDRDILSVDLGKDSRRELLSLVKKELKLTGTYGGDTKATVFCWRFFLDYKKKVLGNLTESEKLLLDLKGGDK
jgi:hypothetical protein